MFYSSVWKYGYQVDLRLVDLPIFFLAVLKPNFPLCYDIVDSCDLEK
jgi:hypothetical protein